VTEVFLCKSATVTEVFLCKSATVTEVFLCKSATVTEVFLCKSATVTKCFYARACSCDSPTSVGVDISQLAQRAHDLRVVRRWVQTVQDVHGGQQRPLLLGPFFELA
jgi:hypothetical protein